VLLLAQTKVRSIVILKASTLCWSILQIGIGAGLNINWFFSTLNIKSSSEKLQKAIEILTQEIIEDNSFSYINEVLLNKIIVSESAKVYHTKAIDIENEKGYYTTYKRVVQRVSDFVLEVNPSYEFPHMLISTTIEGAHQQRYFSEHLPSLTDVEKGKDNVVRFYLDLVFKTIKRD